MVQALVQQVNDAFDAQRAKSRRGYEKAQRRFRKLGLLPEQLAARFTVVDLGTETDSIPDLAGSREQVESHTGHVFAFRIEYQCLVTKNWCPVQGTEAQADKAADLLPECQRLAKAHCGENMRFRIIRPLPGARAVHRIAARKNKSNGEIELYAWST